MELNTEGSFELDTVADWIVDSGASTYIEARLDSAQMALKIMSPPASVVVIVVISSQVDIVSVGLDAERVLE